MLADTQIKSEVASRLQRLTIDGVRNLSGIEFKDLGRVNLICGPNGSGKTSILEAIHILGTGRSFRSIQMKSVIQYEELACTVFGLMNLGESGQLPIGVTRKKNGEYEIRISGDTVNTVSELAETMPVQIINSETFKLLEGGPKVRRQFLDWGVFHVEHSFQGLWKRLQRCLKQRNSSLRHAKISAAEIQIWDRELVQLAEAISPVRKSYFSAFEKAFDIMSGRLFPELKDLDISYFEGWDTARSLEECLFQNRHKDFQYGYTSVGPQKATLNVKLGTIPAEQVLSRGQQKLVVCALKLAQGMLLNELTDKYCIYLVDDLPAELDAKNLERMCQELAKVRGQLFFTSIESTSLASYWSEEENLKLFHVEHGVVSA